MNAVFYYNYTLQSSFRQVQQFYARNDVYNDNQRGEKKKQMLNCHFKNGDVGKISRTVMINTEIVDG